MGKGSRTGRWTSSHHQMFKDKARNRVDDLQGMFTDLQFARRESRTGDVVILEEQVHQMLREWRAELNNSSPACSFHEVSRVSSDLSSDIRRLLQLCEEEEDDATSKLAHEIPNMKSDPHPERVSPRGQQRSEAAALYQEEFLEKDGIERWKRFISDLAGRLHYAVCNSERERSSRKEQQFKHFLQ